MKFLCVPCEEPMQVLESGSPDPSGSLAVVFRCPRCDHSTAMLTNAGETQLVQSLGVHIGPANGPSGPLSHLRANLAQGRADVVQDDEETLEPVWTPEALKRLNAAPPFVRPMIRQSYTDYARQHSLRAITPEVMDTARQALGMG